MSTANSNARTVNTKSVRGYRRLRFNSIGDALAEAERLAAADRAGTLTHLGNWTLGQNLGHLAAFINYPYDGYPPELSSPPWIIRAFLKFKKDAYMAKGLPRGVKIPGIKGGTTGIEPISTDEGVEKLRRAVARLKAAPPAMPNPVFGPLSHAEWQQLHVRHSELHLGYFIAEPAT